MKDNLKYFRHEAKAFRDGKFKYLRRHYGVRGWEMEAKFWVLNSLISEAKNCWLDLSKKYDMASAAEDMELTDEELMEFIEFLIEDAELLLYNQDKGYTTKIVQETLGTVEAGRERVRAFRDKKKAEAGMNSLPKQPEQNQASNVKVPEQEFKVVLDAVMKFFGFTETTNFNHLRDISIMLNLASGELTWPYVRQQIRDYITFKNMTGRPHSFKNWLGSREEKHVDGAWNSENWSKKLQDHKKETGQAPGKIKTDRVKFDY